MKHSSSWDIHTFCNLFLVCLHLTWCRRVMVHPVLAYFAYTWLEDAEKSQAQRWRSSMEWEMKVCSYTLLLLLSLVVFSVIPIFLWTVLLTEFPLLLLPFFTSSIHLSGAVWEIQNGARMSVSFSNCPLTLNIWSYGEEGDPVNGSPCLPCQHHENSLPQGEQGAMCVFQMCVCVWTSSVCAVVMLNRLMNTVYLWKSYCSLNEYFSSI